MGSSVWWPPVSRNDFGGAGWSVTKTPENPSVSAVEAISAIAWLVPNWSIDST